MNTAAKSRALYVLNGFHAGGAELGLAALLEAGFMKEADFRIFAFVEGDAGLEDRITRLVGKDRVTVGTKGMRLSVGALLRGAVILFGTVMRFRPKLAVLSLKQSNIVGRAVLCLFPKVYCICFEHSAWLDEKKIPFVYQALLGLLSFRVDEIWADCHATLEETRKLYPGSKKRPTAIVPLFRATEGAWVKNDYRFTPPFRLAMTGRLVKSKRHELVFRALERLEREGLDITLTLFGTGPDEEELRTRVRALGLGSRVVFKGFVEQWWRRAAGYDALVHVSKREGFCIAVAEAMMAGLPVLALPVGGIGDYSTHGVDAWHLSEGSAGAVAAGMTRLYRDEELRHKIGQNAARNIAARYSEEVVRRQLSRLTGRLL